MPALVAAILLAAASPAPADRVITKTDETFTGAIVEDTAEKVVLKTLRGTVTIARDQVKSVEKSAEPAKPPSGAPAPTQVTVAQVDPSKAAQALKDAKSALVAGEWAKAAGLLEGLMLLDERTLSPEDRLGATGALVTCYLQIKDAQGAAKSLLRRAALTNDPADKKRLVAAADVLKLSGATEIGGKTLSRFEEVLAAAMPYRAQDYLKEANDFAAKATRLNDAAQLDKAAATALKRLAEADVFVPGFSAAHRMEPLAAIFNNVLNAVRRAVESCDKDRQELTQTSLSMPVTVPAARAFNDRVKPYLARREGAEAALKNLQPFAQKNNAAELYTSNEKEITDLLRKLDDLQYYPKGTVFPSMGYYGGPYGGSYGSSYVVPRRLIKLARVG
ncbi:MAG: hypothetical protein NTY65_07250 [Planctomycetota bacterium]|nr:hypothetical protein [Planctomycetota bacterium]